MVKSIATTLGAIVLSLAFFIWVDYYLSEQCHEFYLAVDTLYEKTENEEATKEDATAVRTLWQGKKRKLHIFVPHNDLTQVDYRLNEVVGLLYAEDYEHALCSLEVVREMAKNLPDSYNIKLENIL
jgi:hypothetical protein